MSFTEGLQTLWAIVRREFVTFFVSPLFYLVGGALLAVSGLFFVGSLVQYNSGFTEPTMQPTLGTLAFLMMFVTPLLTMRLVAEETRQGTLELLLTRPVRDWQVIVGKFLATWGVMTIVFLISTLYAFILVWRGNPDQRVIMSGYLGLWLVSGTMIAIGVLTSTLTQYQLVAGMLSLGALVVLWVLDFFAGQITSIFIGASGTFQTVVGDAMTNLALVEHFRPSLLRGFLNVTDIVYFIFMIALSLFLATRVLEARRWRA